MREMEFAGLQPQKLAPAGWPITVGLYDREWKWSSSYPQLSRCQRMAAPVRPDPQVQVLPSAAADRPCPIGAFARRYLGTCCLCSLVRGEVLLSFPISLPSRPSSHSSRTNLTALPPPSTAPIALKTPLTRRVERPPRTFWRGRRRMPQHTVRHHLPDISPTEPAQSPAGKGSRALFASTTSSIHLGIHKHRQSTILIVRAPENLRPVTALVTLSQRPVSCNSLCPPRLTPSRQTTSRGFAFCPSDSRNFEHEHQSTLSYRSRTATAAI